MRKFPKKEVFEAKIINFLAERIYKKLLRPISRFFVKVFKKQGIKKLIGAQVAFFSFTVAAFPSLVATAQTELIRFQPSFEIQVEGGMQTEKSARLPLEHFVITQGYGFFHPAIDLAAPTGTEIYPIMDGEVVFVNRSRFGFGNQVVVDHGNQLKSLYAHLSKIEVKEGDKINKNQVLGRVGSTGRSTGPHLHLQIWENGRLVNPRVFFESYFGQKLASTY